MITGDFHMHTCFSTDGEATMETMALAAIKKGLKSICFTDHWDEDFPYYEEMGKDAFRFDLDAYIKEVSVLKEKYREILTVNTGVELGLQPHLGAFYEKMTKSYPFDFVIGSVHVVNGFDPYFGEIFKEQGDEKGYRQTFRETITCLKNIDAFDVLGHMDYVVRYGENREKEYSYETFSDELDEILRLVIKKGKGLEINTAGWKYGLSFCHPHEKILKRYKELGGEIITIGSDAHRPEHVAYEFAQAEKVLKNCGFHYYTQYKERKPFFIKL